MKARGPLPFFQCSATMCVKFDMAILLDETFITVFFWQIKCASAQKQNKKYTVIINALSLQANAFSGSELINDQKVYLISV